ncbi:MAG: pilus assembly protein PilV [Burkholderiales bacterium]|nr:pilus assembly protein PilV [Burkholderiales bacterium]
MRLNVPRTARRRGFGLIDGLIALVILSFGLLGMSRLQARMVAQATETQSRATAMQFAEELLSLALVDVANAACYTLPQAGVCNSVVAQGQANDWHDRATATLPGSPTAEAALGVDGRMTVTLTWTGRESQDTHSLVAVSDVRP